MPESPNLAIRPTPVVTSEAPTSHVSAAEVAQPYQMLARSLDKVGQGLEDVATPIAEAAGYKAVTRDAEGNIQVEKGLPIFGKAGLAYQHAVKMGALAEGEGAAKRADIALREQYRDNPQGYQVAADAFKEKTVDQYTQAAGPEVGNAMRTAIDNTTTLTYRGLLNEKERLDLARANGSINAGLEDARDDAMALARQGAPVDDKAFKAALDKYHTLLDAKASNPRLAYSQEQRTLDLDKFHSEIGGQRFLHGIDDTYKNKGYDAAMADAKDILTNPDYKLKPAQRESYYHKAVAEIRANESIRNQDYQQAQAAWRETKADLALGNRVEPSVIDAHIRSFQAIGGVKGASGVAAVTSYVAVHNLNDDYPKQPLRFQNNQLDLMAGAPRQRAAYDFYLSKGLTPIQAAGMVGGMRGETANLNTRETHDYGIGLGIAGWNKERLLALRDFAAKNNMSMVDLRTQLEFSWHELQTTEAGTLARLKGARTPEEAGAISVGYFRPANAEAEMRSRGQFARAAYDAFAGGGTITPGSLLSSQGGSAVSTWLMANRQHYTKTAATETWKQVMTDWDHGKGSTPSRETLGDVLDSAKLTNNIDLMARIQRDTELMDYVDRVKQLPLAQQTALENELQRRMAAGDTRQADVPAAMAEPGGDLVHKTLRETTKAIEDGLEKNPIATTTARFADKFKTMPPLDTQNPQAFVQGLAMRAQIAQFAAHHDGIPPRSALDEADVMKVKAALATPDLAQKGAVWAALSTLPDEVREATFEKIAKNDPNALAEASAGAMMRDDPVMAKSIIAGLEALRSNHNGILKAFEPKLGGAEGFDVELPTMLPPTAYGSETRLNPAGTYAVTTRMIQARYAYLAVNDPKGTTFSADRLQQAVNDVTGGTVYQGGAKTVAPERGMSQMKFDRTMLGLTDQDFLGVTGRAGQPISAAYVRQNAKLEAIGQGRYLVNFSDSVNPIYAYTGVGAELAGPRRFVLDLTGRKQGARPEIPPFFIQ